MYKLYSIAGTCSTGITVMLEKMGVDFEVIQRDDVPNYSEIVPTNQVPALDDNGLIITEGAAIALYLLEKEGHAMLPEDMAAKGEFLRFLMFNYATLHPAYSKLFGAKRMIEDSEQKQKFMQDLADKLSDTWAIYDKRLANRKYAVAGDSPTVIDYLLAVYSSWNNRFPEVKITLGSNVERLVKEIADLPEFKAAYARENTEFKAAA